MLSNENLEELGKAGWRKFMNWFRNLRNRRAEADNEDETNTETETVAAFPEYISHEGRTILFELTLRREPVRANQRGMSSDEPKSEYWVFEDTLATVPKPIVEKSAVLGHGVREKPVFELTLKRKVPAFVVGREGRFFWRTAESGETIPAQLVVRFAVPMTSRRLWEAAEAAAREEARKRGAAASTAEAALN